MGNQHIAQRLAGIQTALVGVHQSNSTMSNSSRGTEREAIISRYLGQVLPPAYRFGSGDATDVAGNKSGQLDVVIEYPFFPTLPTLGSFGEQMRLYPAESVAAVVEVKSDIASQWDEAVATAKKLAALNRSFEMTMTMGASPSVKIPMFVAAYTGWKTPETLKAKLTSCPEIAGILVIDSGFYSTSEFYCSGPWALWGLITSLYWATSSLTAASINPLRYVPFR